MEGINNMRLSEYSDDDIIEEIIHRGIELKIHVSSVEVDVSLGGIKLGETKCK